MAGGTTDLTGRVYLVTGASGGIGAAITAHLEELGAQVLAFDLHADAPQGHPFATDLTSRDGNRQAVDAAMAAFGRLDEVVANAGVQHPAPVATFDEDQWDRMIALMLTSPFLLARYAWEHVTAGRSGRFIAMASAHALVASPQKAAYVATKHGVLGLVKTIALEGASHGICAAAVCPGYVRTPLVERQIIEQAAANNVGEAQALNDIILSPHAIKRLLEPAEIAEVVGMLAGPLGSAFTGTHVVMDAGWTAR